MTDKELTDLIGEWLVEANGNQPGYCLELRHLNYVARRAFELGFSKGQNSMRGAMLQAEDSEI